MPASHPPNSNGTAPSYEQPASPPRIATMADLERYEGQHARIEGWYEVTPVAGGKALQPACIVLSDGTRLIRSYRPVASELRFHERRVVVLGKAYRNANEPEYVQQVMAPHVFPDSIGLDPSEPPAPALTDIPTPPTADTLRALESRKGRWVQVFATVVTIRDSSAGGMWVDAIARLDDGTEVDVPTVPESRWRPLQGKLVSFLAQVSEETGSEGRYALSPSMHVCEGRVERCGMSKRIKGPAI